MNTKKLKSTRKLTVCRFNGSNSAFSNNFSEIRLRGKWLKDMGFESGQRVTIECRHHELIIRTEDTRKCNELGERVR